MKKLKFIGIITLAALFAFSTMACDGGGGTGGGGGGDPVHVHEWNDTYTTIANATETTDGVEAITCKHDSSHTKDSRFNGEYATGTAGLVYSNTTYYDPTTETSLPAYSVNRGTATGAVFIPDYHRPDADSPYLPVTQISGGFNGTSSAPNTTLTSVRIPAGVTNISYNTFWHCTSLETVTFAPNSQLTNIATVNGSGTGGVFWNCTSLVSITIPASVTIIGYNTSTAGGVFRDCTSLASVTFEEGSRLTTIGANTFRYCDNLTSISIPASVAIIGSYAFDGYLLASVTFEGTIPSSGFNANAFDMGDLRAKFYATDTANGTPGTYTTTRTGNGSDVSTAVWTKQ